MQTILGCAGRITYAILAAALLMPAPVARAQDLPIRDKAAAKGQTPAEPTGGKGENAGGKKPGDMGLTPAREAAALAFVDEHHPELKTLLSNLKKRHPKQYAAAIRDLFRQSERLAGIQEKEPARYELELRRWKLQSRVQLLSATVQMNPQDDEAKRALKQSLVEQLQLRHEALQLERELLAKRLERIEEQLERSSDNIETSAERQFQAILSGAPVKAKSPPKPVGTERKPAAP